MNAIEERVTVAGATLWTARQGSGPALVLCHGGPGLWDYLGPVACMVDDLAIVYRYDQRACGRSSGEPDYDLTTAVADLEALRAHWDLAHWVVGGHSAGATLALAYALMYPRETAGLLYLCGTGLSDAWRAEYRANRDARMTLEERAELDDLRQRREAAERTGNTEEYAALDRAYCELLWSTDFGDRDHAREIARERARTLFVGDLLPNYLVNRALGAAMDRFTARVDLPARLAALDIPALIVHGEADPRPAWSVYQLAALLPQARLAVQPGAGHLPWLDGAGPLRDALRRFLAAH